MYPRELERRLIGKPAAIVLLALLIWRANTGRVAASNYEEISLPMLDEQSGEDGMGAGTDSMTPACKHSTKSSHLASAPIDHHESNQAGCAAGCADQPEATPDDDSRAGAPALGDYLSSMLSKHSGSSDQEPEINHKDSFSFERVDDKAAGADGHEGWQLDGQAGSKLAGARYTLNSSGGGRDEAGPKWQQDAGGLRKGWWTSSVASRMLNAVPAIRYQAAGKLWTPTALTTSTPTLLEHPAPQYVPARATWPTTLAPPVALTAKQAPVQPQPQVQAAHQQLVGPSSLKGQSELDQQDQGRLSMPIVMGDEPSIVLESQSGQQDSLRRWIDDDKRILASMPGAQRVVASERPPSRARESLLNAAELARQLARRAQNRTITSASHLAGPRMADFHIDPLRSWPPLAKGTDEPRYLGLGQLQRIDPFNGNGRTQARLSCQFSDARSRNISISDVQWVKLGGANLSSPFDRPPFDCADLPANSACSLEPVKTSVLVTVHPRPAIQNYVDTTIPGYSVTLHDVDKSQFGLYRCSARLRLNDKDSIEETVYRIIWFE